MEGKHEAEQKAKRQLTSEKNNDSQGTSSTQKDSIAQQISALQSTLKTIQENMSQATEPSNDSNSNNRTNSNLNNPPSCPSQNSAGLQ